MRIILTASASARGKNIKTNEAQRSKKKANCDYEQSRNNTYRKKKKKTLNPKDEQEKLNVIK